MDRKVVITLATAALLTAVLAASAEDRTARTGFRDAKGRSVGEATLEQTPNGVLIVARFTALPAGAHAFHIHEVGKCDPPFESAGGHFSPHGKHHGFRDAGGPHAGDLPNIQVPESGRTKVETLVRSISLNRGARDSLLDADGSALVVHAGPDDYHTNPAGAAGDRIACAVVTR